MTNQPQAQWQAQAVSMAPGRTEVAGNHTDHQGGRVIAAAIGNATRMELRANQDGCVRVDSVGFPTVQVNLDQLEPRDDERMSTAALVRGVLRGLVDAGAQPCGLDVQVTSDIPAGGGLSSSASFELALGTGAALVWDFEASPLQLAKIGQRAEVEFFGKPCGLMDQIAVAYGGICGFDFHDAANPEVLPLSFDFEQAGLAVCLVDTGCDHSALTAEYAQVAQDMFDAAALFGAQRLSDVPEQRYVEQLAQVRAALGDRAALRGLHFYNEMKLVDQRAQAMRGGDAAAFLDATRRSGASSAQFLQNVAPMGSQQQPAMVALALAERLLDGRGACRIHGGGFGGSIQAFVPLDAVERFEHEMSAQLGTRCLRVDMGAKGASARWM